jgi:hypothetical protein
VPRLAQFSGGAGDLALRLGRFSFDAVNTFFHSGGRCFLFHKNIPVNCQEKSSKKKFCGGGKSTKDVEV